MGKNNNSKSEFLCQNCNSVMDVKMIDSNKSFSKKELLTMMDTEDFSGTNIKEIAKKYILQEKGTPEFITVLEKIQNKKTKTLEVA